MGQGFDGIQDRIGVLFLLASMSGFLSITGSLGTCKLPFRKIN